MNLRTFLTTIATALTLTCSAQERADSGLVLHSFLIGGGRANMLDSYLSPYNYKGGEVRLMRETMRMTTLMQGKASVQTLLEGYGSFTKNRHRTAEEYTAGVRYGIHWHYHLQAARRLQLLVGTGASAFLGGSWLSRNSNNPGQARARLAADLSAMLIYRFRIGQHHYLLRYQATAPVIGMAFSPHYGQSYYEMYELEHNDHNVRFTWPGNLPSFRHILTINIPVRRANLRLGYVGDFQQMKLNGLRHHSYSHCLMVGFAKYFLRTDSDKGKNLTY